MIDRDQSPSGQNDGFCHFDSDGFCRLALKMAMANIALSAFPRILIFIFDYGV